MVKERGRRLVKSVRRQLAILSDKYGFTNVRLESQRYFLEEVKKLKLVKEIARREKELSELKRKGG